MNYEILDALSQITREKSVDRALLIETLEAGLASAVRKKFGATADVEVKFSNETGAITVALRKAVVETVEDAALQLTVQEARVHRADVRVGDVLTFPLPIAEFGRNAIQTAKQVLIQRVREAERDRVFREYSDKIGMLVRGVVQQVDRGNVIVKLDHSEGFLPAREQIPRSYHRQGDYVRAVVINVDKSAKGPQVILSRTHPDFLRRLFESEVPERRGSDPRSPCTPPTLGWTRSARASASRGRGCRASCASWVASASTSFRGRKTQAYSCREPCPRHG